MSSSYVHSRGKIKRGDAEHFVERRNYLAKLVDEFKKTDSGEAKTQVLANIANFAYDPYNHGFLQQLGVHVLLLDEINHNLSKSSSPLTKDFIEISIAGLCNMSANKKLGQKIFICNGIETICNMLNSTKCSVRSRIDALACLIYLKDYYNLNPPVISSLIETLESFMVEDNGTECYKNAIKVFFRICRDRC